MRQRLDQRKDRSMRRGQRCRSNWSRRAGARPVCGPFEREEAVDRAAAVPPSRSKCIIVYNDRKVRERLCDGCQKVTSAQRHDLNLHVEKTITLNDAFPVEHRANTFVQHARQSSRIEKVISKQIIYQGTNILVIIITQKYAQIQITPQLCTALATVLKGLLARRGGPLIEEIHSVPCMQTRLVW